MSIFDVDKDFRKASIVCSESVREAVEGITQALLAVANMLEPEKVMAFWLEDVDEHYYTDLFFKYYMGIIEVYTLKGMHKLGSYPVTKEFISHFINLKMIVDYQCNMIIDFKLDVARREMTFRFYGDCISRDKFYSFKKFFDEVDRRIVKDRRDNESFLYEFTVKC